MTVLKSAIGFERLYHSWRRMHERCSNPNVHNFARYGGAGVTVCPEWKSFDAFKAWALKNGYAPGLTIDRRKTSMGYSPDNCRWATAREQTLNRHTVAKDAAGVAYHDIAKANGIKARTYQDRVERGWTPEKAATTAAKPALGRYSRKDSR